MKKRKTGFLLLLLVALLGGCGKTDSQTPQQETEQTETTEETGDSQGATRAKVIQRAAWCVYWDENSAKAAEESFSDYEELKEWWKNEK